MKSDALALLELAAWPVLLVDGGGRIRRANRHASQTFGQVVEGEASLLSAIWAPGNAAKPDQFLAGCLRAPIAHVELKLLIKGGQSQTLATQLAPANFEGQEYRVK